MVEYAGARLRFLAFLVDLGLTMLVILPIEILVYGDQIFESDRIFVGSLDFFVSFVFPVVATILFWNWRGATPGKQLLSLQVVDQTTYGRPSFFQCVKRYFYYIVSGFFLGLGYFSIIFDSRHLGWHDKLSGTAVIKSKKETLDSSETSQNEVV